MKRKLFEQKNYLSNNKNSNISGVYTLISQDSNIQLKESKFINNYIHVTLNNSNLINNDNKSFITINNINNSNISIDKNCVISSQTDGSLINFPQPIYHLPLTQISENDSVFYPASNLLVSKDIVSDGISAFFNSFIDSTLYHDITFYIDSNGVIASAKIDNIDILIYDKQSLALNLQSVLNNLPKNLNGYKYYFNFNNTTINNSLQFNNFYGGNLILNFTGTNILSSCIFKNCDNITLNGSCTVKNSDNIIFQFDDCFNVILSSLTLDFNTTVTNKEIKGNLINYPDSRSLLVFKNSNIQIISCKFNNSNYNSNYIYYSLMAFNSKILLDQNTTIDSNLKMLLDEFSLGSTNKVENTVQELIIDTANKNIDVSPVTNQYINNGLYNHMHTDYLVQQNSVPIGSIAAYQYWYREKEYKEYLSSLIEKTVYSQNQISGVATILASNSISLFPSQFLPLCCQGNVSDVLLSTFLSTNYNILKTHQYTSSLFSNSNNPFINTICPNEDYSYDLSNNILLQSMFFEGTQLRSTNRDAMNNIEYIVKCQKIDNHDARPQTVQINYQGNKIQFYYPVNPGENCSKSGRTDKPFIYNQNATLYIRDLLSTMLGSKILSDNSVTSYINNNYYLSDQKKLKEFNTIFEYSTFTFGNTLVYTVKQILKDLLIENYNIIPDSVSSEKPHAPKNHSPSDRASLAQYFPIKFKICVLPTLANIENYVNLLVFNSIQGSIDYTQNSRSVGYKRGGYNGQYLYADSGDASHQTYSLNSNAQLKPLSSYISNADILNQLKNKKTNGYYKYYTNTVLCFNTDNKNYNSSITSGDVPPHIDINDYYHYFRIFKHASGLMNIDNTSKNIILSYSGENTFLDYQYGTQTNKQGSYNITDQINNQSSTTSINLLSANTFNYFDFFNTDTQNKNILYFVTAKIFSYSYNIFTHNRNKTQDTYQNYSFLNENTLFITTIQNYDRYSFYKVTNQLLNFYKDKILYSNTDDVNPQTYNLYFLNYKEEINSLSDDYKFSLNISLYKTYLVYKTIDYILKLYLNTIHCLSFDTSSFNVIQTTNKSYPLNKTNITNNLVKYQFDSELSEKEKQIIKYSYNYYIISGQNSYFNIPYTVVDKVNDLSSNSNFSVYSLYSSNNIDDDYRYISIFKDNNYLTTKYSDNKNLSTVIQTEQFSYNTIQCYTLNKNITSLKYRNYLYLSDFQQIINLNEDLSVTGTIPNNFIGYSKSSITEQWSNETIICLGDTISSNLEICDSIKNFIDRQSTKKYLKFVFETHQYIYTNFNGLSCTYVYNKDKQYKDKNIFMYTEPTINNTSLLTILNNNYNNFYKVLANKINKHIQILSGLTTQQALISYENLLLSPDFNIGIINSTDYNDYYNILVSNHNTVINNLNTGYYTTQTAKSDLVNYLFKKAPVIKYGKNGIIIDSHYDTSINSYYFQDRINF